MAEINYESLACKLNETLAIHSSFEAALKEVRRAVTHAGRYDDPQVFVLLGESRSGKTRVLETIESENPSYRTPEGTIMPIVRIRVPKGATTNGVFSLILHAMGDRFTGRSTETDKLIRLLGFAEKLKVRVIVIDEFQHLVRFNQRSEFDTADALKVLADVASVNLVVAGLSYARIVIDSNPQLAGRARNPITMKRFDWNDPDDRFEFIQVVSAFANELHPLRFPDFNGEEWGFRWFCATGGLVGYVAKLFKETLDNAQDENSTKITMANLDAAHRSIFVRKASTLVRPFTADFTVQPTEDSMRFALSIGRVDDDWDDAKAHRAVAA